MNYDNVTVDKSLISRAFNKANYDKKTLTIFEIVGCFFVDNMYNHLFSLAKDSDELRDRFGSLTDAYKQSLKQYLHGIKSVGKYYQQVINNLHKYYQDYTSFSGIILEDFINNVLRQYIPDEHFKVLGMNDKYFFLSTIIIDILENFIREISSVEMMKMVIDERTSENALIWKNKIIDIQIMIREKFHIKFVKQHLKETEKVDAAVFENFKKKCVEQIEKLVREKCDLETSLEKMKAVVAAVETEKREAVAVRDASRTLISEVIQRNRKLLKEIPTDILNKIGVDVSNMIIEEKKHRKHKTIPGVKHAPIVDDRNKVSRNKANDRYGRMNRNKLEDKEEIDEDGRKNEEDMEDNTNEDGNDNEDNEDNEDKNEEDEDNEGEDEEDGAEGAENDEEDAEEGAEDDEGAIEEGSKEQNNKQQNARLRIEEMRAERRKKKEKMRANIGGDDDNEAEDGASPFLQGLD